MNQAKFKNPPAKFRGAPFWGWNGKMEQAEIERQIEIFKEMGFGGCHIHPRTGLDTAYMGEEYLALVKACVEKGKAEGMYTYLYDEDRWPSGFAGGLVTKNPAFRARQLLFTPVSYEEYGEVSFAPDFSVTHTRAGNGTLLACFDVVLDEQGNLAHFCRIPAEADAASTKWYAYAETALPSPWFNGYTNVDVLNPDAIDAFLAETHQKYFETVGEDFGTTIPSIFTDEPQVTFKDTLANPFEKKDLLLAWTDALPAEYTRLYQADLLDVLPLLFWEGEGAQTVRYRYHNTVSEMFCCHFADRIGAWCEKHNIQFTGHMVSEGNLHEQTQNTGDIMRAYRGFQVPGVDVLLDATDYTSVKQTASSARQFGAGGVLSELYGVMDWDADFRDHKFQGDWQAALGVTLRCHHLSWYTMAGEAKRDYPPSLNYHAPWYRQYADLENHFSRLGYALSLGKADAKIGVLNPIESLWPHFGPDSQTMDVQNEIQYTYDFIIHTLLRNHIDFDCISEANMERLYRPGGTGLQLGECNYDVILLPYCETMRPSTVKMLTALQNAGGKVLFFGCTPKYLDGVIAENAFSNAPVCALNKETLLAELADYRTVRVLGQDGKPAEKLFSRYVTTPDGVRYLFFAACDKPLSRQNTAGTPVTICLAGEFMPEICDTFTGEITPIAAEYKDGNTYIDYTFYDFASLLLQLTPGKSVQSQPEHPIKNRIPVPVPTAMEYALSEPNVLLLDRAEFLLDDVPFCEETDIITADTALRRHLGLPCRMDVVAEPWTLPDVYPYTLSMVFRFTSEIPLEDAYFAAENMAQCTVTCDGAAIENKICGYYVDKAIQTIPLPPLSAGSHTIVLRMPFGEKANPENCFILGDFGVRVTGEQAVITALPEKLTFGDVTAQGLAFYGGNITYRIPATGNVLVSNLLYTGTAVSVNGDTKATFAPYSIAAFCDGILELTVYGNRFNTFGALHNTLDKLYKSHPNEWRTTGAEWTDVYQIRPWGVLEKPVMEILE